MAPFRRAYGAGERVGPLHVVVVAGCARRIDPVYDRVPVLAGVPLFCKFGGPNSDGSEKRGGLRIGVRDGVGSSLVIGSGGCSWVRGLSIGGVV